MYSYVVRAVNIFMFAFLLLLACLQLNDPDPVMWTLFYCVCALPPLLACIRRHYIWLNAAVMAFALVMAGVYFGGFSDYLAVSSDEALMQGMNPEKPYIEEAREFIGALIALAIVLPYMGYSIINRKTHSTDL